MAKVGQNIVEDTKQHFPFVDVLIFGKNDIFELSYFTIHESHSRKIYCNEFLLSFPFESTKAI